MRCFFGFLRSAEFTVTPNLSATNCLQISDLSVDSLPFANFIWLRITVSKVDPFRESCIVITGRNYAQLCHVEALLKLLHLKWIVQAHFMYFETVPFLLVRS